jgi:mRNA interferase HigB
MTVVGKQILEKFIKKHARAGASLRPWLAEAECSEWKTTQDIRSRFNSADFLSDNRVVFNIGGNKFRLVVIAYYAAGILKIDRIGTHAEYDKWNLK